MDEMSWFAMGHAWRWGFSRLQMAGLKFRGKSVALPLGGKITAVRAEAMRKDRGCVKRLPISREKPGIQVSSVSKVACRFGYLLQKCES
ncbi:hypothetical protein [Comamonas guangdongensis]|uniref:Uncharacterized protein n=1 Tax=Comamonas guangdongensis TaxID=510515 RepID=A0ABV3ZQY7_9BURK